jgi:hypothetical protein
MQGASMCQMEASLITVSRLREIPVPMEKNSRKQICTIIFNLLFSIQIYKILNIAARYSS